MKSDLDNLFTLPLTEFTDARNALAARLKRDKQTDDANLVKALSKPSVSAWAVNQLYWEHRDAYDRLTESGARFREAQSSVLAGKSADLRGPTDARRAALSELSRLAASLLTEAGHNPAPETMRRIAATLEAISVHVKLPDEQTAGHLTHDIDPPGFDALTSAGPIPVRPSAAPMSKTALQDAERKLATARESVRSAEAASKSADADAKRAEKEKQEARERYEEATSVYDAAAQIARRALANLELETRALKDAEREAEKAIREFNSAQ